MQNLAAIITKKAVTQALQEASTEKVNLRQGTRFHLIYKGNAYPPKEIIRLAARQMDISDLDNYRLNGGPDTNDYLIKMGFKIVTHTQLVAHAKPTIEKRVARICWNDKSWIEHSGKSGKSKDKKSHEYRFGYGHEEWLFDTSKIINGYHYAFLEPVRKQHQAYQNNTYNIWLYSIDGETKKRYFIGEICNAIVIDEAEAVWVYEQYKNNGWLDEMENQIIESGANNNGLSGFINANMFNIKFKPVDIDFKSYYKLPDTHVAYSVNRYSFNLFQDNYNVITAPKTFVFTPPQSINSNTTSLSSKKVHREPKEIEIKNLHRVISDNLTKLLREQYGNNNVTPEHPTFYGMNRIDIVVNDNGKLIFYEIKTYSSLQTSIREAFGQIMEYAHWVNANNANELIIVTQPLKNDSEANDYIKHLRKLFNIPIYLQMFDIEAKELSEKY